MIELLPCPFCGGEAHMSLSSDGYGVQCWNRRCIDMQMEEIPTEAEAIAAWNTRYHSEFEKTVIKAWEEIKNYTERTCQIEYPYYGDAPVINGQPRCSECKTEFAVGTFPNYCPNCGAKVIGG